MSLFKGHLHGDKHMHLRGILPFQVWCDTDLGVLSIFECKWDSSTNFVGKLETWNGVMYLILNLSHGTIHHFKFDIYFILKYLDFFFKKNKWQQSFFRDYIQWILASFFGSRIARAPSQHPTEICSLKQRQKTSMFHFVLSTSPPLYYSFLFFLFLQTLS